jgi:hypothetical protein
LTIYVSGATHIDIALTSNILPAVAIVITLPIEAGRVLLIGPHWNVLRLGLIVVSWLFIHSNWLLVIIDLLWSWLIIHWLRIVSRRGRSLKARIAQEVFDPSARFSK